MVNVILIRHGITEENKNRILSGCSDVPICSLGIDQMLQVSERLSVFNIDSIFSSPQKRAIVSAEIIAKKYSLKVRIESRLKERNYGLYDGLTIENLINKRKQLEHEYLDPTQDWYGVNGVESDKEIHQRFLHFIYEQNIKKDKTIILVSHAGFIVSVIRCCLGIDKPLGILKIKNGSYIHMSINERVEINAIVPPM